VEELHPEQETEDHNNDDDLTVAEESSQVVILEGVSKAFPGSEELVLKDINLRVPRGSMIAIAGPSGSGKTTLLFIIAGLLRPSSGIVQVFNKGFCDATQEELAEIRGMNIGFVFQHYHMIPTLTVLENVMLPADLLGNAKGEKIAEKGRELLCDLGLQHRADHLPSQLSGGELQRTAFARALINDPVLLLCDEPTANLDRSTARLIADKIEQQKDLGKTVIVVTHDVGLTRNADSILLLSNGMLRQEEPME
jgi:ABC-type lipoprotein export system ATPase subunit